MINQIKLFTVSRKLNSSITYVKICSSNWSLVMRNAVKMQGSPIADRFFFSLLLLLFKFKHFLSSKVQGRQSTIKRVQRNREEEEGHESSNLVPRYYNTLPPFYITYILSTSTQEKVLTWVMRYPLYQADVDSDRSSLKL